MKIVNQWIVYYNGSYRILSEVSGGRYFMEAWEDGANPIEAEEALRILSSYSDKKQTDNPC